MYETKADASSTSPTRMVRFELSEMIDSFQRAPSSRAPPSGAGRGRACARSARLGEHERELGVCLIELAREFGDRVLGCLLSSGAVFLPAMAASSSSVAAAAARRSSSTFSVMSLYTLMLMMKSVRPAAAFDFLRWISTSKCSSLSRSGCWQSWTWATLRRRCAA